MTLAGWPIRVVTAVSVIALCLFCVSRGWSVVRLQRSLALGRELPAGDTLDWGGAPTVGIAALDGMLRDMNGEAGIEAADRRSDVLARLLAARPLSSVGWLSLAGMRLVTGQPYDQVLATAKMSSVTAPNEEAIMWQRGVFGLLQWEALPADARDRTVTDLSGVMLDGEVNDRQVDLARFALVAKTPDTRSQIAALLIAEGVQPRALARLGL